MQNVLKNVENIVLNDIVNRSDIFGQLANYCQKLKYLEVQRHRAPTNMFLKYLPTLEYLVYWPGIKYELGHELRNFLEKHSNLRRFETLSRFLWGNRNVLNQTNCQLDLLNVCYYFDDNRPIDQFIECLKALYERRFFKSLQFTFVNDARDVDHEHLSNAISTLPALEKLLIWRYSVVPIDISRLTSLKALRIEALRSPLVILAKNLLNLERLDVHEFDIDTILPFMRYSKRLKTIKTDDEFNTGLDLFALNEERKKLAKECAYKK